MGRRIKGYIISTDELRKFLWQDESEFKHDKLVFTIAQSIISYMLSRTKDVVFDATNLTVSRRQTLIKLAREQGAQVILHWVDCPVQTAAARNLNRARKVPIVVIKSMFKSFQKPRLEEGLDAIKVYDENLDLERIILPGIVLKR